jgi:hypothetical protein
LPYGSNRVSNEFPSLPHYEQTFPSRFDPQRFRSLSLLEERRPDACDADADQHAGRGPSEIRIGAFAAGDGERREGKRKSGGSDSNAFSDALKSAETRERESREPKASLNAFTGRCRSEFFCGDHHIQGFPKKVTKLLRNGLDTFSATGEKAYPFRKPNQ